MSLIVNADDFGISREVNEAIVKSFEKGLINRTTLMVNMPYAKEAMELASEHGFADRVGLHLNLTAGVPLTEDMSKDSVMCADGSFSAEFARNMKTRFVLPAQTAQLVRKEIVAQLNMYKELGGKLWHIDSHHHVHTDPSVYTQLVKAIKNYPVTGIRLGRNMYRGGNPVMHMYKAVLNASIRKRCYVRPDFFGSSADFSGYTQSLKNSEEKKCFTDRYEVEVMVHPMINEEGKLTDSMEEFVKLL